MNKETVEVQDFFCNIFIELTLFKETAIEFFNSGGTKVGAGCFNVYPWSQTLKTSIILSVSWPKYVLNPFLNSGAL